MHYELALISVVVAGTYWGWFFLVRQPHGTPTFGVMQLAAAALSGIGLYGHHSDGPAWMGGAGAVGLGAGACLLVLGPVVRSAARRLAQADRPWLARKLLDLAEILAPGSGVSDEKALLGAMTEIREGRIEHSVDALTAARDSASTEARLAIDERIAMLYLAAYRWKDAIAHAESHIFNLELDEPDPGNSALLPLRRALGVAPPVWVELLGAYGRTGDLDRAAQMLARLEDVCANRDDAAMWIHHARLMFLALAGRPAAVAALVEPRQARHMSRAARTYWMGVAHEHDGNRSAATAAYRKARGSSRGRSRELIESALDNVQNGDGLAVRLSTEATEVVARVEAAPMPAPVRVTSPKRPWATYGLTAAMLVVAGVITLLVGSTRDVGVLTRAGGLVRGMIDGGEWWRIFSCVFVHLGLAHLAVNVLGVWFVGRIAEELFGTTRTLAIFFAAGSAGAAASYLVGPTSVAGGASGALFGLLGAVFIELTWHRARYHQAWKRGMWGGLAVVIVAVVIVAQLGFGLINPGVEQWSHGAGLAAGIILAGLLSPHAPWSTLGRQLGRAVAFLGLAFTIVAAVDVARTSVEDSLMRLPRITHALGGVTIVAPANWQNEISLSDPDGLVVVNVERNELGDEQLQLLQWQRSLPDAMMKNGDYARVAIAPYRIVPQVRGWYGQEYLASYDDEMGNTQVSRVLAYGRVLEHELVTVTMVAPDSMIAAAPNYFRFLYGSVRVPEVAHRSVPRTLD
ncbi:MAG TPA: rhomboid family intramembrane serine protease [Kofleriaceae bacterium]|jgi:rhomboid protease GluP